MNNAPIQIPAKPLSRRKYVKEQASGRYYITAKVEQIAHGFDAWHVTADIRTGSYVKRGKIFADEVSARRWLEKQSVSVNV